MAGEKQHSDGRTDGQIFGQTVTDKIGFYAATPVAQRAAGTGAAVAITASTSTTPFGYTTAAQADAIVRLVNEMRATLTGLGLMVGS